MLGQNETRLREIEGAARRHSVQVYSAESTGVPTSSIGQPREAELLPDQIAGVEMPDAFPLFLTAYR